MIKLNFLTSFLFILNFVSAQVSCDECTINFTGFCRTFNSEDFTYVVQEFKNGQAIGIWFKFDKNRNLIKQLNTTNKIDSLNEIYPYFFNKNVVVPVPDYDRTIDLKYEQYKDSINRENEIFEVVEEPAVFVGGTSELMKWIVKNLEYPKIAIEEGLQGKVYIRFVVEKDGSVSNPKVMRGISDCPMCDKEAIRLVKSLPKWTPAIHEGRIVRSYVIIPIRFSLD
jgi:TonB family protein